MKRDPHKLILLAVSLLGPVLSAGAAAPEARMSWLENGEIKLGVDLSLGGSITWLSGADGVNRVNNFDHGRQIQLSYFSGPAPFETSEQKPSEHWRHLGWNPIQSGDDFRNGSKVVEHRNDGRSIYVKCLPLQWPLDRVPGECFFESWLELESSVLKARARLTMARSDRTQYSARLQELPALYANAAYHRVVSYSGARPHSGEAAGLMPASLTEHPWTFWIGTEQWSALLDEKDEGLGLITPGRYWFTGGFAGRPGGNDTHATDTGYLAGQALEILDHNAVHQFRYEVVVGSLTEIRARAATHAAQAPPFWRFTNDRQGWHYRDARDSGWPIAGGLEVLPDGADPQLISPIFFWEAEEAPELVMEAAFATGEPRATLYWRRLGEPGPGPKDHLVFPVPEGDGFHQFVVPLGECPSYRGPIVQLRLDPVSEGRAKAKVRIRSIGLRWSGPKPDLP
jgi:hypothetical protein